MKKTLLGVLVFAGLAFGQRSVGLSWTASTSPNALYNVYRQAGACPAGTGALTGNKLNATPLATTATTYSDTTVIEGQTYCYYLKATLNTLESGPSNTAEAAIAPLPPTGLNRTVALVIKNEKGIVLASLDLGMVRLP